MSDFNECSRNPNPCSINADCTNTEGSYECECHVGFLGDGWTCKSKCVFIDIIFFSVISILSLNRYYATGYF